MARLTEEMVIARSKQSDLSSIKKLSCWGAELDDVSLLRRMPNVEMLVFSINKIQTLVDFAGCRRLRELYVRKNEISDLHEIRHLRRLPDLKILWLAENPCTQHPEYRMTVLRNVPNLEKLDNVAVHAEEVQEAMRRGAHIPDSDDEGYPQQEYSYSNGDRFSAGEARGAGRGGGGEGGEASPPLYQDPSYEKPERSESYQQVPQRCAAEWEQDRGSARDRDREYPSAVMAEHRGFTSRPVARNSNLLSAVLCLVKELDYPSLEVADIAVRCRMDELANSP